MPVHVWAAALLLPLILFGTLPAWTHGSVIVQRIQDLPLSSGRQSPDSLCNLSDQLGSSLSNRQNVPGNSKEYFGSLVSLATRSIGGLGRDDTKGRYLFQIGPDKSAHRTRFQSISSRR